MEVINTLLANSALKAGQWLQPSKSQRSKSINEKKTHFTADESAVEVREEGGQRSERGGATTEGLFQLVPKH